MALMQEISPRPKAQPLWLGCAWDRKRPLSSSIFFSERNVSTSSRKDSTMQTTSGKKQIKIDRGDDSFHVSESLSRNQNNQIASLQQAFPSCLRLTNHPSTRYASGKKKSAIIVSISFTWRVLSCINIIAESQNISAIVVEEKAAGAKQYVMRYAGMINWCTCVLCWTPFWNAVVCVWACYRFVLVWYIDDHK